MRFPIVGKPFASTQQMSTCRAFEQEEVVSSGDFTGRGFCLWPRKKKGHQAPSQPNCPAEVHPDLPFLAFLEFPAFFSVSSKRLVIFFFPYNPHPPPIPTNPPGRPTREGLISVHFGSVWLRSAPFGSVWLRLAPFRVCSGSVSGPFRGCWVGSWWGR